MNNFPLKNAPNTLLCVLVFLFFIVDVFDVIDLFFVVVVFVPASLISLDIGQLFLPKQQQDTFVQPKCS